jgi:hypothetical protein
MEADLKYDYRDFVRDKDDAEQRRGLLSVQRDPPRGSDHRIVVTQEGGC